MKRCVLVVVLAFCLSACSNDTLNAEASGSFDGPCDPTGTWLVHYEPIEDLSLCIQPLSAQEFAIDPLSVLPVSWVSGSIVRLQIENSAVSPDGCSIWAHWDLTTEEGLELHGEANELILELTSPTRANGTLAHSDFSGCGHAHATFAADATLE